jgi:hypothetical protein
MQVNNRRDECPSEVKRELRRRAEYGCCRCGLPIYEYHHIIPYSVEQHFRADDMMILCPNAHSEATAGAFTEPEQRYYQQHPFNVERGYAGGMLKINQDYCAVAVGNSLLVGQGALIRVDGQRLLQLSLGEAGEVQISVDLLGEDGTPLAIIDRNEWISGSPEAWDIESSHQQLTIREREGVVSLRLDAKSEPISLRARLRYSDWLVDLRPAGIFIKQGQEEWPITGTNLAFVDMAFECDTSAKEVRINPYLGVGKVVSEADPIQRLIQAVNLWKRERPRSRS